jgi:hypothetical protein
MKRARWTQRFTWLGRRSVIPYVHGESVILLCILSTSVALT